ncbi:MAG: hypothetical protein HQL02_10270 [Nitrospirae bacterium]|nr:hypothetical protein [Nitrospirota bacterium]
MSLIAVPKVLKERLGEEATDVFIRLINEAGIDTRKELATKEDVSRLRDDLRRVEAGLKEDMLKLEARLKDGMNKLEVRFKDDMNRQGASFKDDIHRLEATLFKMEAGIREDMHNQIAELVKVVTKLSETVIKVKGDLTYIKWIMGTLIPIVVGILVKLLFR